MFETFKTIINILRDKDVPHQGPKGINISLEELCQLWLPYNNAFQVEPVNDSEKKEVIAPEITNSEQAVDVITADAIPTAASEQTKKNIQISTWYDEVVQPYVHKTPEDIIQGVNEVIEMLKQHGNCPSIVMDGSDGELSDITGVRDIIAKVPLIDHSFRTAKIITSLAKDAFGQESIVAVMVIITALCHDLGKIPEMRNNGRFAKGDHSIISSKIFEEIFVQKLNNYWFSRVIGAIKEHHLVTNDQFSLMLKEADAKARSLEIAEKSSLISVKEWNKWFVSQQYLELIEPFVNTYQMGKVRAFSVNGTVYCEPSLLYEQARIMAIKEKVIETSLLKESDMETALRKIVGSMRDSNVLSPELGPGYLSRRYEVVYERGKRKEHFIPIVLAAFKDHVEIEKRWQSRPEAIREIISL